MVNFKKIMGLLSVFIFIFVNSFGNSSFTLICSGNYFGEYKNLDKNYEAIKSIENSKKKILKIDIGNNLTENNDINKIFYDYYNMLNFNINFLGTEELEVFIKKNRILNKEYISLNVDYKNIEPYKIFNIDSVNIAIIGITDVYDSELENITYYKSELQKLLYKLENKVECIFVVSDLSRAENLDLIKSFSEIDIVIESGKNINIESVIKTSKKQYILPVNNLSFYDIEYNKNGVKMYDSFGHTITREKFVIQNSYEIDIDYYDGDISFKKIIDKEKNIIDMKNQVIAGYNDQTFSKQDMIVGDRVEIVDNIAKKMSYYYNGDLVIAPSYVLKSGMYKGLYSEYEIDNIFSNDKILVFYITLDDLKKLIMESEKNRGTSKYLYFYGLEKIIKKPKYKIITFDCFFKDYQNYIGDKYNIREYGIKDILRRGLYEQ